MALAYRSQTGYVSSYLDWTRTLLSPGWTDPGARRVGRVAEETPVADGGFQGFVECGPKEWGAWHAVVVVQPEP